MNTLLLLPKSWLRIFLRLMSEKAKVCNEHFIAVAQKLAEDIPSIDESPTANITPTKTKFQFGCITIAQIYFIVEKVIKRLN